MKCFSFYYYCLKDESESVSNCNNYFLTDESLDSLSSDGASPRVAALPPTLKRALPEKEKEGQKALKPRGSANKITQDGGWRDLSGAKSL